MRKTLHCIVRTSSADCTSMLRFMHTSRRANNMQLAASDWHKQVSDLVRGLNAQRRQATAWSHTGWSHISPNIAVEPDRQKLILNMGAARLFEREYSSKTDGSVNVNVSLSRKAAAPQGNDIRSHTDDQVVDGDQHTREHAQSATPEACSADCSADIEPDNFVADAPTGASVQVRAVSWCNLYVQRSMA